MGLIEILRRHGRTLLALLGVVAVVLLIHEAGTKSVFGALRRAGPWLIVIIALEVGWAASDVFALRILLGPDAKKVPFGLWLRSAGTAYVVMILLPVGRAGGEIARASLLAPVLGPRAAAAGLKLQSVALTANGLTSLICLPEVLMRTALFSAPAVLVAVNGSVTMGLGVGLFFLAINGRLGTRLGRRFRRVEQSGAEVDEILQSDRRFPVRAVMASWLGRALQTVQYGVILHAVGGSFGLSASLVAQAVHLVGAGLGDFVPNAVGITEGAYRVFAEDLGLVGSAAQGISIALVARIAQLLLGGAALLLRPGSLDPGTGATHDGPHADG